MTIASHLAEAECALLRLIAEGLTDEQIAPELHVTVTTVRTYGERLRRKTGCRNRAQLTRYAVALNLVPAHWAPPDPEMP